jgi:hypothetical protein
MHGGAAPQVQRSARQRLAELHDPAVKRFARALKSGDDKTALRAAEGVMKFSADHTPSGEIPTTFDVAGAKERLMAKLRDLAARTPPSFSDLGCATAEERAIAEDLTRRWTQRWLEARKNRAALPAPLTERQGDV